MAEFAGDFQSFKSSLPFLEVDSSMELINQFAELNPSLLENPNLSIQSFLGFSGDNFLTQKQSEKLMNFGDDRQGLFHLAGPIVLPVIQPMASAGNVQLESKKIKVMEVAESSSGGNSSAGGDNKIKRKNNLGGGKRERSKEKRVEKPKEVIHVRARRGQATDNHSLAERVRREKINEKLKHLQDLVPGCYKTMGMAVMLDEIINYVKSLQNQVEFLSMKLSAASSFHDFNLEMEAMKIMQGANAYEAKDVERLMSEGYGGLTCFPTTWLI